MIKRIKIFLILFVATFSLLYSTNKSSIHVPVSIKYLGNMGVVITSGDTKILIDALHKDYGSDYLQPDEKLQKEIINFGADILLCTHVHHDHFNEFLTSQYLFKNKNAVFIGPQQTSDSTKKSNPNFEKIKERILVTDNNKFGKKEFKIGDVKITAFNVVHVGEERHSWVQNTIYQIEISGKKLLHVGDADENLVHYELLNLAEEKIDLLMLPVWFLNEKGRETIKYFNSDKVIILHVSPKSSERMKGITKHFPNFSAFTKFFDEIVLD